MRKLMAMAVNHGKAFFGLTTMTVCLAISSTGYANTYYVGKNGNNANTCTQVQTAATPKLTIRGALSCIGSGSTAGAGHTVTVNTGTYAEEFSDLPGGTSWNAPFTLKANSGATVTIQPPASGACDGKPCFVFLIETGAYIVIDGFILDGLNIRYDAIKIYSNHVRVQNSEIKDSFSNCVYTSEGDTYHEFINLNVHACGIRDVAYGGHNSFYITGNHNLVANSTVHDGAAGIMAWHDVQNPSFNTFRDNTVYNMAGGTGLGVGIGLYKGTGNQAINNVISGIDGPGISVRYGCSACQMLNNTVYGSTGGPFNEGFGIEIGAGITNAMVKNNIAWGNAQADVSNLGTGTSLSNNLCATGTCTITQDPLFVDAANKNFRLQSTSPAVNAGVNLAPTVVNDILGTPRTQNGAYDIGAYECTSESAYNTPPATPKNLRVQ